MAKKVLRVTKTGKVSFHTTFKCRDDPTGGSIEFGVSTDAVTPPSTWAAGVWDSFTALVGRAEADTPTMGESGAGLDLTSFDPGRLILWYRLTVGLEVDELPWDGGSIQLIS